jgi:hypothetical protein
METVCNKTEGKAKSKMVGRREEWLEEDGSEQLETKDAGEEEMERNNWASQNSHRVVELKKNMNYKFPVQFRPLGIPLIVSFHLQAAVQPRITDGMCMYGVLVLQRSDVL